MLVLVAGLSACDRNPAQTPGDAQVPPEDDAPERNQPPVANAGPDAKYLIDAAFTLDGTASTDPDGTIVSYQWSIAAQPAGSVAVLGNALDATASFTPDAVGTYTFSLVVTDNEGATDEDTVIIVVPWLTVSAGPDQTVVWRSTVQLGGSYTSDITPTVTWGFVSRPPTSTAVLQSASTTTPTFFADKVGTFVIELSVTTSAGSVTDTVTVTVVPPPPDPIAGDIVDIDIGYGGQVIIASTNPPRIRVIDLVYTLPPQEMEIPLSITPTAIGVSETGEFVSIIHDGTRLTRARIPSLQVLNTVDTHTTLLDVRHGTANPHAYPAQAGPLMLVDYTDEKVYAGATVAGPSRGRQASTPDYPIYVIELGASAKLRRFYGGQQDTPFVRDWPYPAGQYPLGNDLWFAGELLITSTGHVFNISDNDPAADMTHRTLLAGDTPFEIVGVASAPGEIVTLNTRITAPLEPPETQVRYYNYLTLALEHVVTLPDLVVGGTPQPTLGLAITTPTNATNHVFVIATGGTQTAVFTVPNP
jgi:hypothetical protein